MRKSPKRQQVTHQRVRWSRWLVPAIVLIGLALRIGFILTKPPVELYWDEPLYDQWGKLYQSGWQSMVGAGSGPTLWDAFRASLQKGEVYAATVGAIYAVAGADPRAVLLVQAVLDSITCLLLYGLARALGGVPAGVIALALSALYEPFIFSAARLQTETMTALVYVAGLWALCVPERRRSDGHFIAGVLFAIAMLIRPALQFLVAVLLPMVLVRSSDRPRRERLVLAVALVLGFAFVIAPRMLVTKVVSGQALWGGTLDPGADMYGGAVLDNVGWKTNRLAFTQPPRDELLAVLGGDPTRAPRVEDYRRAAIRVWLTHPIDSAAVALHKLYVAWLYPYNDSRWTYLSGASGIGVWHRVVLILGLIGMPLALQRWRVGLVLIAATIYLWLTYVLVKIEVRYAIAPMPLMICFAGVTLAAAGKGWQDAWRSGRRRHLAVLIGGAILALLAVQAASIARIMELLPLTADAAHAVRVSLILGAILWMAFIAGELTAHPWPRTTGRVALVPSTGLAMLIVLFGWPLAQTWREWEATLVPNHGIARQELVLPASVAPPTAALLKLDLLPGGAHDFDVVVRLDGEELRRYAGGVTRNDADLPAESGYQRLVVAQRRTEELDKAWYTIPIPRDRVVAGARLTVDVSLEGRGESTGSLTIFGDYPPDEGTYLGPSLLSPFANADTSLFKFLADGDGRLRRRIRLGGSGRSRFFDGVTWSEDDLAFASGRQQGRYRIFLVLVYDDRIIVV